MKNKQPSIHDYCLRLLRENEKARNSDKFLIFRVWKELGYVDYDHESGDYYITEQSFWEAPQIDNIRRARQKIQELHPELCPTNPEVAKKRGRKQATKGSFIFAEGVRTGDMF